MAQQQTLPVPASTAGVSFSATLENSRIIKGIVEAVMYLIDETYMYMSPSGLKLNAIDSSHVAMLLAFLPREMFTDYKCPADTKVGITVMDLVKILRRAGSKDEIQFVIDTKDKNMLHVIMKGERAKSTYKIKSKEIPGYDAREEGLLESFEETLKDKFSATIHMEGPVLGDIVKNALIISDLMKVQVMSAEKVMNFNASDESGEVAIEIDLEGKGVLDKKVQGDAEGIYSLNFLENIIKIQSITSNFKIALGNNIPMRIEGAIKASDKDDGKPSTGNPVEGKIVYLLAPRVEDNDEFSDDVDDDEAGSSEPVPEEEGKVDGE